MTISDNGQFSSTAKSWKLVTGSSGSRCMAAILQRFLLILTALYLSDNWHAGTRFKKKVVSRKNNMDSVADCV